MLIPGFLAGDNTLGLMTQWLRRTGHRTRKAGMRSNIGCSETETKRLEQRLEELVAEHGQRVAIVGHSRGGSFARVLAYRRPDLVSGIVTLGAPTARQLAAHPIIRGSVLAVGLLGTIGVPGFFKASCLADKCCSPFWKDLSQPLPPGIGFLSIYSKSDGIVDWHACLDPAAQQLEVDASHCGMATHPVVYRAIAEALSRFRAADISAAARPSRRRRTAQRSSYLRAA